MLFLSYPPLPGNHDSPVTIFSTQKAEVVITFLSGGLGNGLKQLELSKVGLIAHPMQNLIRNMVGTLSLVCGGLMMSKSRILDGPPSWDFRLEGHQVWREIQITNMSSTKTIPTTWIPCWCHFCKSWLLTLFRELEIY